MTFLLQRDLFYLSKSYGERIRQRNFAMNHGAQTARVHHSNYPYLPYLPKPSSNPDTSRPMQFDDESKSKETKTSPLNQTYSAHSTTGDESDETGSTRNQNRIFGAKYESSQVTTTTTESERETSSDQHDARAKKRENLSTVQEEKSNQNSRAKKH